ncbi:MAG: hypothetical protein C0621_03460 [Desulfuromonas sp.]|nr:MAG: hypothetical protein C0621_03460 [Desulfuromonas sp.]
MRARSLRRILPLFLGLFIAACGSNNGGGGGDVLDLLPYRGLESAALLDASNVEEISELAFFVPAEIPDLSAALNDGMALASRSSALASELIAQRALGDSWSETGSCGGTLAVQVFVNEQTLAFSATLFAASYCDDETILDGTLQLSGHLDSTLTLSDVITTFTPLRLQSEGLDVTLAGTFDRPAVLNEVAETRLNLHLRDNLDNKTYRLLDYRTTRGVIGDHFSETVSGRAYHPDYGYIDLLTATPLLRRLSEEYPYAGTLLCRGAEERQIRFRAISNAAYHINADLNSDGLFDEIVGEIVHYPGENNPPQISSGNDAVGNIGCGAVTIDGASSSDLDGDILSTAWSFQSRPANSTTLLTASDTLAPSFIPDVEGEYRLQLSVDDGFSIAPVTATVTINVYGNLFCLAEQIFLPAVQESKPTAVTIADVTSDGRSDVLFLTASTETLNSDPAQDNHLYVFAQDATGVLSPAVSYAAGDGDALVATDLNGNGRTDVAVTRRTGLGLLLQSAQGTLDPLQPLNYGVTIDRYEPHTLVTADFTGDGRNDLASAYSDFTASSIRLYPQNSSGNFDAPQLYSGEPGYWHGHAADIDGDLDNDLILAGTDLGKGSVLIGAFARLLPQTGGTLTPPVPYLDDNTLSPETFCSTAFALGDLNGDNHPDIATSCQGLSAEHAMLRIYPQQNDGRLGPPQNSTAPATYSALGVYPLSGTSRLDLVALETGNSMNIDIYRPGPDAPQAAETYPAGFPNYNYSGQAYALGDINSDGAVDLVIALYVGDGERNGLLVIPGNPNR